MTISRLDATIEDATTFELNAAIRKARELNSSRLWRTAGYSARHVADSAYGSGFRVQVFKRDGTFKGYYAEEN